MDPVGKVVLVTGASSGIGAATARALVSAGAHVVLTARDAARLNDLARQLKGRARAIPVDVADPIGVERLVAEIIDSYRRIDVVINNAGVGLASPVAQLKPDDLRAALDVNLFGPLSLTQATLPHMRNVGRGQIIFVSSVVGLRALPYAGGYAATKAALDRLSEALRVELHGSGITVTLVRPGTTRTAFNTRRLGVHGDLRRFNPPGIAPECVAETIVRAIRREPRVAYVTWSDRLAVGTALLLPRLADWLLARLFVWRGSDGKGVPYANPER
ncbi:SDR family NAD(P)-dependent oxidoreductase [Roseiflexus castenholzii]|jgi:short-subunit dehydrogenase|uniref:Short-chain dehydrogenase/reductase SDR n=1 Tax=Roseiflexus castenholzii (strain DSM 13941 / HLO8) TaxID=383372 RepID=A7NQU7_ROSCS|nr:SDR family oxidoreductase [Roseiflexus castenholzii]ABU59943.1 short-chain dehydrogenase/reductase SDR [Roseiflexus castenholzii DSM 13941]